ncbi:MAG: carboxypeptidase-like regulatory domain-containing protein [Ignavibacteriaceae bacterium]
MKLFIYVLLFSFIPALLFSQTKITGKVTDSENQPLPGANVFIKDSYDGISTKEDGSFSFTTTEEGDAILVVSFLGYKSVEKNIQLTGKEINIDIVLEEEAEPHSIL